MRAYPDENVEYTFIFPNRKEYTLIFIKEDADGRLVFFNKTTNAMTSMPQNRFSYLGRFSLVSKKHVPDFDKDTVLNSKKSVSSSFYPLSPREKQLLSLFRTLGPFEQESIFIQMRTLSENKIETIKK